MSRLELGSGLGGILALLLAVSVGCGPSPETKRPPEKEPDALHSVRMAQSLFRAGRVSEALTALDEGIAREPDNAGLHSYYGLLCLQSGRLDEAVDALERALEIDPHLTDAHNVLGTVYLEQGRSTEAEEQFREALEDTAYPTPEKVHLNLGLLYDSQGRDMEAVESFRMSVGIDPQYYKAHFHLASTLDRIGRLDEAAREYEVAEPAFKNDGEYWYRRGFAYYRLGRAGNALESLQRVRVVAPGSASAARADELLELLD